MQEHRSSRRSRCRRHRPAARCPKHMANIDQSLAANPKLNPVKLAEITKLRADGEMLHKQGKHAVSEAALGQAESIFAIKKL